jgi:hypothetical protein
MAYEKPFLLKYDCLTPLPPLQNVGRGPLSLGTLERNHRRLGLICGYRVDTTDAPSSSLATRIMTATSHTASAQIS